MEPTSGKHIVWRCRCAFVPYLDKKQKGVKRPQELKTTDDWCGAKITAGQSTGKSTKGQWKLTSVNLDHTYCTASANMSAQGIAAASTFRAAVEGNRGVPASALTSTLKEQHVDPSSKAKVYRAKDLVTGEDGADYYSSFLKLMSYKTEFELNSPGSVMRVHSQKDGDGRETFVSASIAPSLGAGLWEMACQHVVAVDGAHIKNKEYNHVLLLAVTFVAGFMIPLAAAISPTESTSGYNLLLSTAAAAGIDLNKTAAASRTVVIADRHKGVKASMDQMVRPVLCSVSL